jgi:excisionase family DNA binding protein
VREVDVDSRHTPAVLAVLVIVAISRGSYVIRCHLVKFLEGEYQASAMRKRYDGSMKGLAEPSAIHGLWERTALDNKPDYHSRPWEKEDPDRETTGRNTPTPNTPKLLLTVDEAAEALSLGRTFFYELLMRGDLASIKIGSRRRIPVSALHEFVVRQISGQVTATHPANGASGAKGGVREVYWRGKRWGRGVRSAHPPAAGSGQARAYGLSDAPTEPTIPTTCALASGVLSLHARHMKTKKEEYEESPRRWWVVW